MAVDPSLIAALKKALIGAKSLGYNAKAQSDDVYEAYTMSLIVVAARKLNCTIRYESGTGRSVTTRLKFRTSSGYIHTATKFTHVVVMFRDSRVEPLQLHVGVRLRGTSGVDHEADVAALPMWAGRRARYRYCPRIADQAVTAECKFYAKGIPLGQARAAIGLEREGTPRRFLFAANNQSNSVERYFRHHYPVTLVSGLMPGSHAEQTALCFFDEALREWEVRFR